MKLTFKYRIKNRSARKVLCAHAWAVNQVWNYCNAHQRDIERRYREGAAKRWWPTKFDLHKLTAGTSRELGIHSVTINGVCDQYVRSREAARHSVRFRASSGPKRALGWVPFKEGARQVSGNAVTYLGKAFKFFGAKRRPLPETATSGAFVEDAQGRWWVTFSVEADTRELATGTVGIDLGLKTLATLSNGQKIDPMQPFRIYAEKLAVAQRAGNKTRAKALHAKIANVRRDFLHKASAKIARENGFIAVGNVSSSKLVKTRMAKSVLDAGWSTFRNMLSYKASRHSATFLEVDEAFTSQTCSSCGTLPTSRPKGIAGLGIRTWECSDCGASHDRDVNAARNILRIALSAQRPDGGSRTKTNKRIGTTPERRGSFLVEAHPTTTPTQDSKS